MVSSTWRGPNAREHAFDGGLQALCLGQLVARHVRVAAVVGDAKLMVVVHVRWWGGKAAAPQRNLAHEATGGEATPHGRHDTVLPRVRTCASPCLAVVSALSRPASAP